MKKCAVKVLSLLLAVAMVISMTACSPDPEKPAKKYDVPALVNSILTQVSFDDTLTEVGVSAGLYFPELPENATAKMYLGSGYFADEVALITLASADDMKAARASVDTHLAQLRAQFQNYIPEEVGKIEKAFVWQYEEYILVCITDDYANAKLIVDHADDPNYRIPGGKDPTDGTTVPPTTGTTTPPTTTPPTTTPPTTTPPTTPPLTTEPPYSIPPVTHDPSVALRPDGYPAITSQSGTYSKLQNGILAVDNRGFEGCGYSEGIAASYAALVNKVAVALKGVTNVYSLPIPTSFGIMMPDDVQAIYPCYTNQGESIENVLSKMDASVIPVRCYDNLMNHRNEYLYFRTDHHWNGIGAYYAYEAFCEAKGITPYTMQEREEVQFDGFLGTLYINSGNAAALAEPDTVYAYRPMSSTASMVFYNSNGNPTKWPILADVSGWGQSGKYNTFAGGDNPLTVFTNPEVTDGSVCIVVKESYGNALMPYLVDHYSTIYEVDYRYWTGDLAEYAKQVGADDLLFANNIMMISTGVLVGMMDKVIN